MITSRVGMLVPALLISTTALAAGPEPLETDAVAVAEVSHLISGLEAKGYANIRFVGTGHGRLVAVDRDGSEVFITIDPRKEIVASVESISATEQAAPGPFETDAAAVAEPAEVMGGQSLQDVSDGLTKQGYRSIRPVGPNRLVAFNRDGRAVILTIDSDQGTIMRRDLPGMGN